MVLRSRTPRATVPNRAVGRLGERAVSICTAIKIHLRYQFFAVFSEYNLLLNLYNGSIMENEIDNKRQDVGNANSLHPYAGDATSHTAYNAPNQV